MKRDRLLPRYGLELLALLAILGIPTHVERCTAEPAVAKDGPVLVTDRLEVGS